MQRLEFFRSLKHLTGGARLRQYLTYRLAPVVDGLKPAELLVFRSDILDLYGPWLTFGTALTAEMGLSAVVLREREESVTILVYKERHLRDSLDECGDCILLEEAGYPHHDFQGQLDCLARRFCRECPHEIGLFLGFPREDVDGFIENRGENYLLSGYWKVYHRPEKAKRLFQAMDRSMNRQLFLLNSKC